MVVATRDHHIDPGAHFSDEPDFVDSWPPHCVVGTGGAEFHDALQPRPFDAVFHKGEHEAAYSGFEGVSPSEGEPLADWLRDRGVDAVDVCGIATDYCVRATALDAAGGRARRHRAARPHRRGGPRPHRRHAGGVRGGGRAGPGFAAPVIPSWRW